MPRRELLTDQERVAFESLPTAHRELVRHYTLNAEDLALVQRRRRPANRLGFAVQLCLVRYPGRALRVEEQVPLAMLHFVAEQLGVSVEVWSSYAERKATRRQHLSELRQELGLCSYTPSLAKELAADQHDLARQTDNGKVLIGALIEKLLERGILLPPIRALERLASEIRHRAMQTIYGDLTEGLNAQQLGLLKDLLVVESGKSRSPLRWILEPAQRASPKNLLGRLERLQRIRDLGLGPDRGQLIPGHRLRQLAREGRRTTLRHFLDFEPTRRQATLVAVLDQSQRSLIDDSLRMHDDMMGGLFRKGEALQVETYQARRNAIRSSVARFARIGRVLLDAKANGSDPLAALERIASWRELEALVAEAEGLSEAKAFDVIANLETRYPYVRKYAPALLENIQLSAAAPRQDLLRAVEILRTLNDQGQRSVPSEAPLSFVPGRWRGYVETNGRISRRFYELCVLTELRNALRSGDIFVEGSNRFRDFEDYLLPKATYSEMRQELPLAVDTRLKTYLAERAKRLHQELARVERLAAQDKLPRASWSGGRLRVHATPKLLNSPTIEPLMREAYRLLPRIKITELLLEVDRWTGFSKAFTHLRSGKEPPDRRTLLTAVLSDAINLGLTIMARSCPEVSFHRLTWTADWHIHDEGYRRALTKIVNFQHQVPFAWYWGDGTTSSSDGQRFHAGGRGASLGHYNARYGTEPGVMFYTHISDQYSPFHTAVINAPARDATFVLDGLLEHETELKIEEHYADTSGFTDHVFGLCQLLGVRFAPRIRNLGKHRIYSIETPSKYSALAPLIGGKVDIGRIAAQWEEILRLATSIRVGTVSASLILRKLGSYPRQNGLAWALRELGRMERTFFTLDWLQDIELRQRVQAGLNKGEAKNALARAIFFNRLGELRDRSFEDQRYRASGLNLVVAAITLWNTVYLGEAVDLLRQQGQQIIDTDLSRLSPLGWEHINLTGDYAWQSADDWRFDHLRPLRNNDPASA